MTRKTLAFILMIFLFVSLACNAPLSLLDARPTLPPPPTAGVIIGTTIPTTNNNEPVPTATLVNGNNGGSQSALPTFTPRPNNTGNNSAPAATVSAETATPTPAVNTGGPLNFNYTVSWRLDTNSGEAIATVTIAPSGGDGNYSYFRDELPVNGPIFEYRWATCTGNPGSFRVTSGDGQSKKVDYFEQSPCN